ncbi:MAG: hypothetical protein NW208_19120 [Bryobacter sp.]|nr:hypothetical protein [Bryobacter sp.]
MGWRIGRIVAIGLFLNYGLDVVLFPWAYGLPGTISAEGEWVGTVYLANGTERLVALELSHQALRFIPPTEAFGFRGDLAYCEAGRRQDFADAMIGAQPAMAWTGEELVLAFADGIAAGDWPVNFVCKASSDELDCDTGEKDRRTKFRRLGAERGLPCQ